VLVLCGLATLWWVRRTADPYAALAEIESHGTHVHDFVPPAAAGVTPAMQLEELGTSLRSDPDNPRLLSARIHLALEQDPAVAVEECRRILARSPRNYFALHHAAMAYLQMTNLERALHFAARTLEVRDTTEGRFVAGHVLYARSDYAGALEHYRTILAREPGHDAALHYVRKTEQALAAAGDRPPPADAPAARGGPAGSRVRPRRGRRSRG
jgi:tetratricopeptide (TPR) repeat protein